MPNALQRGFQKLRQGVGNYADAFGTTYRLPELGISEGLAGGNTTIRTGAKPVAGRTTPSGASIYPTSTTGVAGAGQPLTFRAVQQPSGQVLGATDVAPGAEYRPNPQATQDRQLREFNAMITALGGGTGTGAAVDPFRQSFQGQEYTSEQDLLNAQNAYYNSLYSQRLSELGTLKTQRTGELERALMEQLGVGFDGTQGLNLQTAGGELGRQRDELGRSKDAALRNIGVGFSNMGGIRQSAQGYLEGQTGEEFGRSQGALERALSSYLADVMRSREDINTEAGRQEQQLASDYVNNRDNLNNALFDIPGFSGSLNTEGASVNDQSGLANDLNNVRQTGTLGRALGQAGQGQANLAAILKYLQGNYA